MNGSDILTVIIVIAIILTGIYFIMQFLDKIKLRRLKQEYNADKEKDKSGERQQRKTTSENRFTEGRRSLSDFSEQAFTPRGSNISAPSEVVRSESPSGQDSDSRREKKQADVGRRKLRKFRRGI